MWTFEASSKVKNLIGMASSVIEHFWIAYRFLLYLFLLFPRKIMIVLYSVGIVKEKKWKSNFFNLNLLKKNIFELMDFYLFTFFRRWSKYKMKRVLFILRNSFYCLKDNIHYYRQSALPWLAIYRNHYFKLLTCSR